MVVEKNSSSASTHEKKKSTQLRLGVGGGCVLGGVVLFGGGLAVAGLMAAFTTIMKNRNAATTDQKQQKKEIDEESSASAPSPTPSDNKVHDGSSTHQGLTSVLQNPTTALHQNSCCTNHQTPAIGLTESHTDSQELVSAHEMALGDQIEPIIDEEKEDPSRYQQEILFSDELNKEILESCNEEPYNVPEPENMIKSESCENMQLTENTEMKKEDEPVSEPEQLALEGNFPKHLEEIKDVVSENCGMDQEEDESQEEEIGPGENSIMRPVEEEEQEQEKESDEEEENVQVQPVEEEEGDDEDDHDDVCGGNHGNDDSSEEDVTEKEDESSEETGSSSRESNVEAIWPTDMIEALSHELKVMNSNNHNSVEQMAKTECDDYVNSKSENGSKTQTSLLLNKKTPQEFIMEKVETIHLPTREVCVWSMLAVVFLLLLVHIHRTSPLQDLSYENSVIGPRV